MHPDNTWEGVSILGIVFRKRGCKSVAIEPAISQCSREIVPTAQKLNHLMLRQWIIYLLHLQGKTDERSGCYFSRLQKKRGTSYKGELLERNKSLLVGTNRIQTCSRDAVVIYYRKLARNCAFCWLLGFCSPNPPAQEGQGPNCTRHTWWGLQDQQGRARAEGFTA